MKRILVPCDFSKLSMEAFRMANDLASITNGEIVVLYAIYIPTLYDPALMGETMAYNAQLITDLEDESKKNFAKMKKEYGNDSVKASLEILTGGVIESIHSIIESRKIDLVMMGTSGASGLEEFFIGSNTEKVVRNASVPVLAIRAFRSVETIRNILLPSTLQLDQTAFMKKLKELQSFFHATLHVLLVNTPIHFMRDAEAKEAFHEFARQYDLTNCVFHFKNYRSEEEGILDFMQSGKADLVAMGTHARKGLAHLFNGSITEDVVNHIQSSLVWTYTL
ncbi:MAG TPA: universal stress protein [Ohtaekwangia sp.]|uniref:universal stress protein n=1 Tax=Ohtaekwangia sp. TaxID=2066019 RepID=UPI002F92DE17